MIYGALVLAALCLYLWSDRRELAEDVRRTLQKRKRKATYRRMSENPRRVRGLKGWRMWCVGLDHETQLPILTSTAVPIHAWRGPVVWSHLEPELDAPLHPTRAFNTAALATIAGINTAALATIAGIYAFSLPDYFPISEVYGFPWGQVEALGKTVRHEKGWRAAGAIVREIHLPRCACGASPEFFAFLWAAWHRFIQRPGEVVAVPQGWALPSPPRKSAAFEDVPSVVEEHKVEYDEIPRRWPGHSVPHASQMWRFLCARCFKRRPAMRPDLDTVFVPVFPTSSRLPCRRTGTRSWPIERVVSAWAERYACTVVVPEPDEFLLKHAGALPLDYGPGLHLKSDLARFPA